LGKLYGGGAVATSSIVFLGILFKSVFKRQKTRPDPITPFDPITPLTPLLLLLLYSFWA